MGSLSDFLENELLDHVLQVGSYSPPTIYVALSTADPTDDASGIAEPSGNGYARKAHSAWDAAASRLTENTGVVTFDAASGAWGTITHYAIYDASTAGNMLAHGSLSVEKDIVNGNTASIADGEIEISFSAGAIFTTLANALLDHVFGNGAYSVPDVHVALSTTIPTDGGPNITEPSGSNYARVDVSAWDAAAAGATENTGAVNFPTPSGSWGACVYVVICDALTGTDYLFYGDITDQTPDNGDTVRFNAGELDITLT